MIYKRLIVSQLAKFPIFMEPKGALPCLQAHATEHYLEPVEFNPHPHTLFLLRTNYMV